MAKAVIVEILGDASKFVKSTKDVTSQATLMGSVLQGVGINMGMGMASLAEEGVGKVVDFMKDAVKGAVEDQRAMAGLTASLAANVAGWDGNTEAIQKNLDAGLSKGFSDVQLVDSMKVLVAATHDVTEAQKLQATAMDLARFKGISLDEASQALVKVEGGQYRMLKSLGIVLEKGATQTQALAAVQKVAGGQAAAYMNTLAGKSEEVNVKLDKLSADIGAVLIPALSDAADGALNLIDALSPSSEMTLPERLQAAGDGLKYLNPLMWGSLLASAAMSDGQEAAAEAAGKAAMAYDTGSERIGQALDKEKQKSATTATDMTADNKAVRMSYSQLAAFFLGAYSSDLKTAMDIEDARAQLSADRAKTAAAEKTLASGSASAKQIADAQATLREVEKDEAAQYAALASAHSLSETDYNAWYKVVQGLYDSASGDAKAYYGRVMQDIADLRDAAKNDIVQKVVIKVTAGGGALTGGGGYQKLAGGGTAAGGLTIVGEEGAELVDLPAGSRVYSHEDSLRMARTPEGGGWGSGGSSAPVVNINIAQGAYIDGPSVDALARQIAQRLNLVGIA